MQKRFGARVVEMRKLHGFTQVRLSVRTGISVEHISNLENGHREPCLGNMAKLAKAFGLKLDQLVKDID